MNTFHIPACQLDQLASAEEKQVLDFLCDLSQTDNPQDLWVAIRGQSDPYDDDDEYFTVYGCYCMTSKEVQNYYQSGSVWQYEPFTQYFATAFGCEV